MNLFKLVGSIFIDSEEANKSISKTESQTESLAQKFVKGVGAAAKWGAGITAAATGMATVASAAITKVAEETREYRTEMGKLETAFETSGHSAETSKKTYEGLQAILGDTGQAVEAANHLAKLCKSEEELSTWTNICTGVYAEFGASLPIEGLAEAANETAKTGALTGGLADALNWAGINEEEFQAKLDKCNTEQERTAFITETMNRLYADSAEKYRINNEEIIKANEAQEKFNGTMARIGEIVEPAVTTMKLLGATILEKGVTAILEFGDKANEKIPIVNKLKDGVDLLNEKYQQAKEFVDIVIKGWQSAIEWGQKHSDVVAVIAIGIGTLTTAIIGYNAAQAIKNAGGIAELAQLALLQIQIWGLTAAEVAHTAATTAGTVATTAFGTAVAFLTSPVTLVIAAIGALVAAGVLLYKNWDTVKEKAYELYGNITKKFEELKSAVLGKFESIKNGIKEKIENARDVVKTVIDKIKGFFKFSVSLPKIKLPHFKIKPSGWELGDLLKGSIPKLGIEWYKKAMDNPVMFTEPTLFGVDSSGRARGAGEAGDEIMLGKDTLFKMIAEVVAAQNEPMNYYLQKIIQILAEYFPQILDALLYMDIVLDDRTIVGRLTPKINKELGILQAREERGR